MKPFAGIVAVGISMAMLTGCNKSEKTADAGRQGNNAAATEARATPSPELEQYVVDGGAPKGAVGVAKTRETVTDGKQVVMVGRVKDFVEGKAMFTMMDSSVPSCADEPGDNCPTPWDYCCEPKDRVVKNSATVKIVDGGKGDVMDGMIQGVRSLDHLTTVVVEGKANRDKAGNLVVNASRIYING